MGKIHFVKQRESMDCAAACVKSLLQYYNLDLSINELRRHLRTGKGGASVESILNYLNSINFNPEVKFLTAEALNKSHLPAIALWQQNHYVVIYKIGNDKYYVMNPAIGKISLSTEEFRTEWLINDGKGLIISTDKTNYLKSGSITAQPYQNSINTLFLKLLKYKRGIIQVLLTLLIGSIIQLIIPFLTQSIVDKGISNHDLGFIQLVILAQFVLFIGSSLMNFFRSWMMIHIGIRINIDLSTSYIESILSRNVDFLKRKKDGDLLERLVDNIRIEKFLTSSTISLLVAVMNLVIFGAVLLYFNLSIFLIFLISSILLTLWILFFLSKRKIIDNQRFALSAQTRSEFLEIIHGMEAIKMNGLGIEKKEDWITTQIKLLNVRLKYLLVSQYQKGGAMTISRFKDILITLFTATGVINGHITLGSMLAIQYIVGQLNSPVLSIVSYIQTRQDAQLSYERLSDVVVSDKNPTSQTTISKRNWEDTTIELRYVSHSYDNFQVLSGFDLRIPSGSHYSIVGKSGSGKTTILKIICGLVQPAGGSVMIGGENLKNYNLSEYHHKFSSVFQESHIFSASISYNISLSKELTAMENQKVEEALKLACIKKFVDNLPAEVDTIIGKGGRALSRGQKQRIIIARAIYKSGDILLLDEATNTLDNVTEEKVMKNLFTVFKNKTIISVAHRLHTIKGADKIIVLDNGEIVETGTHNSLLEQSGFYYKYSLGGK